MKPRLVFRRSCNPYVLRSIATFVIGIAALSPAQKPQSRPESLSVTVTNPGPAGASVGDGPDFATTVLADPWDMNVSTDVSYVHYLSNVTFEDGFMTGTTSPSVNENSYLHLLYQGTFSAQTQGKTGAEYPIDANYYRTLSFRMYLSSANPSDQAYVYWFRAPGYNTSGSSQAIPVYSGWRTYVLDLPSSAATGSWDGTITGLRLDPIHRSGVTVKLDWVRLTPLSAQPFSIQWQASYTSPEALVNLSYDDDRDPNNGTVGLIAKGLRASAGNQYSWSTGFLAPGKYYPVAEMGTDYAAVLRGDAWDMSQTSDVSASHLVNVQSSGGWLKGDTSGGNAELNMNLDPNYTLDTNLFKELAFNVSLSYDTQWLVYASPDNWRTAYNIVGNWQPISAGVHQVVIRLDNYPDWPNKHMTNVRLDFEELGRSLHLELDYVRLSSPGGDINLVRDSSDGALTVNSQGVLKFTNPTLTTGPDYATVELNNGWDMNGSGSSGDGDVTELREIARTSYSNGVLNATTSGGHKPCTDPYHHTDWGDSQVYLNVGPQGIDTSVYRYITFRYKQYGTQDVGCGWIARFLWSQSEDIFSGTSTMEDIVIDDEWPYDGSNDGWHSYTIDLSRAALEAGSPGWNGTIHSLRFDPSEVPTPIEFDLDSITLTGDPVSDGQFPLGWTLNNLDDTGTVTLYRDNDRNYANGGRTLIATLGNNPTGYTWDTTGLPNGKYYVYAEVEDSINSAGWYSDVPVQVISPPTIRLTDPAGQRVSSGDDYTVEFETTNAEGGKVDLSWVPAPGTCGEETIVTDLSATDTTYDWGLSGMSPDAYWLRATVHSAYGTTVTTETPGPLVITQQTDAALRVTPSNPRISVSRRRGVSRPTNLLIDNLGVNNFTWNASTDRDWLSVTPASGSSEPATIQVTADMRGKALGTYTATVTINAGAEGVVNVPVTVDVLNHDPNVFLPNVSQLSCN